MAEVPPAVGEPCDYQELSTLFLFEKLAPERLQWLCDHGRVERIGPGSIFREGEPARFFYVLLDGEIETFRRVGSEDVLVGRTSQRGVYAGAWTAYLGENAPEHYLNSLRATVSCRFFRLPATDFATLVHEWFPMAVHLLEGLFWGNRGSQQAIGQRERLLALGSLSAGLTHELNNPAAAAVRATSALRERVAGMRHKLAVITGSPFDRETMETLLQLQEDAVEHAAKAPSLRPLEASAREDEIGDWLDEMGLPRGWEIASTFVQAGLTVDWLRQVADRVRGPAFGGAVRWLGYTLETELLMDEIQDATTRISTLVAAAKQYSQVGRAPVRDVDVHELLDSTLIMLGASLRPGVRVVKDYDRSLPEIPVHAAEINQVWTNLIDNAVQAMGGEGTLTVSTSRRDDTLRVEIADTGVGIPEGDQPRIFEPFFTTKPVGEGTGLGLDITRRIVVDRHRGDIAVSSEPGDTRFTVTLPLHGSADRRLTPSEE